MRAFGDVEAVKILLDQDFEPQQRVSLPPVHDPWHVAIVRDGQNLSKYVRAAVSRAIHIYHEQIQIEQNTTGRVVELRHPVRLSGGIRDSIELVEQSEAVLDRFEQRFESLTKRATFEQGDIYEALAKETLNFKNTIIPRTRLHTHTYLWILWVHESLNHAIQFHGLMKNQYDFEDLTHDSFPYLSHPPLIVAIIACSTMIEEVGATWLNAYINDIDYTMDQTNVRSVLCDIQRHYSERDEFSIGEIEEWVVDNRNEISHYITRRGDTVSLEEFEEFVKAVQEGIRLVDSLLSELVMPPLEGFQQQLSRLAQ